MIIYCTSVTQPMSCLLAYARMIVLEKGTGAARLIQPEPYLNQQQELLFAEKLLTEHQDGGIVITASSYELPVLRLLSRVREGILNPSDFTVHCIIQRNEITRERVRVLHVDRTGEFIDRWPEGFYEARMGELF